MSRLASLARRATKGGGIIPAPARHPFAFRPPLSPPSSSSAATAHGPFAPPHSKRWGSTGPGKPVEKEVDSPPMPQKFNPASAAPLTGKIDTFNCVDITCLPEYTDQNGVIDVKAFASQLKRSMATWRSEGRRGLWLRLPCPAGAHLLPVMMEHGFETHHCTKEYIMVNQWLVEGESNNLPCGPLHHVGVAGLVLNSKGQLLVIQEQRGPAAGRKLWKLPGGKVDHGESIWETAEREVEEETGIKANFQQLSSILEAHVFEGPARQGSSDLYCICILEAVDKEAAPVPQASEIEAAKWMDLEELLAGPLYQKSETFNYQIRTAYQIARGEATGLAVTPVKWGYRPGTGMLYHSKNATVSKL